MLLNRIQHLVVRSLGAGSGGQALTPLISLVPMSPGAEVCIVPLKPDVPVRLSAFALLKTDGAMLAIESPLSLYRVALHRPEAGAIAAALARPITPAQLAKQSTLSPRLVADMLAYLAAAGAVVVAEPDEDGGHGEVPRFAEDHDPALSGWSPTELAFHVHSTLGRHDHDFGATYPFGTQPCPDPLVKQHPPGPRISLPRPDLAGLMADDVPFAAVLESRSSIRSYSAEPPTARQLGELLYRSLRTRALVGPPGAGVEESTSADRPYPAGGAIHELEFYIVVEACTGIEPGVYAYDTVDHALVPVEAKETIRSSLLAHARVAGNLDRPPPVLIMITARVRRIQWKYAGLGYALMLKHVGVVQQTLYLVACAMGLAACAISNSEIDQSARALDLDWRTESPLGSFAIGLPRAGHAAARQNAARHPVNDAQPRGREPAGRDRADGDELGEEHCSSGTDDDTSSAETDVDHHMSAERPSDETSEFPLRHTGVCRRTPGRFIHGVHGRRPADVCRAAVKSSHWPRTYHRTRYRAKV
jgi:SagB-type dehydrogenase family enzyme